jgi:hypothetical protein
MAETRVAIVGSGPAGLMAAEVISAAGVGVDIYEAMPSYGRKFLMAGKSGLNITHAEEKARFLKRYPAPDARLVAAVEAFGADEIVSWMHGLGIKEKTGSTGRVFPEMMKSSPLLRAWVARLETAGVRFFPRHRWQGWDEEGRLLFRTPDGVIDVHAAATVFAMGGGSWKRLGSDGSWLPHLQEKGVNIAPFLPSNCGFTVDWSAKMREDFAGMPVKAVQLKAGEATSRAEFVITQNGIESGGVYSLSAILRHELLKAGSAELTIDLLPDHDIEKVRAQLEKPRGKQSLSNFLRKSLKLTPVKVALLYEVVSRDVMQDPAQFAEEIKALSITLTGTAPMDEAISTAGGVAWSSLDEHMMLTALPGHFCAGEMVDWDAPTGGYLITACLATGRAAGKGVLQYLER